LITRIKPKVFLGFFIVALWGQPILAAAVFQAAMDSLESESAG
jgi:hypothetical protein